jgi:hypothetical protein
VKKAYMPVAVAAFSLATAAPALDLIRAGQPVSAIVVPDAATDTERAGAERLVKYLKLASGAELPVVKEAAKPAATTLISVGQTALAKQAGLTTEGLQYDGYRLRVRDGVLYLLGRDTDMLVGQWANPIPAGAQGSLRAAFGLLDRLGFRWLQPTPEGTYVPELKTVAVPDDLNVTYEPPLMFMHGRMNNWGDWSMANSCRTAIKNFTMGGHTWGPSIPNALFDEHPDYFVMIKGQRLLNGQYCSSSPGAQKCVADWTMGILKQGYEMVALGQSDGFQPCECEACSKLSPADQVHTAHRKIIEMIGAQYPDRKVHVLIYPPTEVPPSQSTAYPPNTVVELCLTGSLREAFGSHEKALEYWQKAAPGGVTVYAYCMGPWFAEGLAPRYYPDMAATNLLMWLAHGVKGVYWCGGGENWGAEGPTYYVLGRLATDPTLDWHAIYDEYLTLTFRNAAPAMKQYYDLLYQRLAAFRNFKDTFVTAAGTNPDDSFPTLYPPWVLTYLRRFLDQARQQAGDDAKALGWIRLAEFSYNHFALIAKAFHYYRVQELSPSDANLAQVRDAMSAYHVWVDAALKLEQTDPAFYRDFFPNSCANLGHPWTDERLRFNHSRLGCAPFNLDLTKTAAPAPAPVAPAAAGWTLQFSDDFERQDLGNDWRSVAGDWRIVRGVLTTGAPSGNSYKLLCLKDFPGAQRLEYDASTDTPGDLSAVLAADQNGAWDSGYFFGFGSDENQSSKLRIQGGEPHFYFGKVEPGKVYHVVCQREGDTVTHTVDGKTLLTFKDPKPLTGEGHRRISLYIWPAGRMDNVKVYTKPE